MQKISEATKEQILAINIERVIEPYVDFVKKSGRNGLMACCPFHNEKTPSFVVDTERGFFKCFGCGAGGNSITFIMRHLNFTYYDALIFLAEKFGINVEYEGSTSKNFKDITSLQEEIQIQLRKNLYLPIGKEAKDYILSRSFTDEDLNEFGIGFVPAKSDFSQIFQKYSKNILLSSGFFKENQNNIYSRFFNRLTLPIKSITGSVAAFAGRSIDGTMPKYLNSSDSDTFHKGNTLFNIDKAKSVMKNSGCIVVEGYFDVIRLHQIGIKNVVAPMGTALTKNQISLIKRYSDDITVIFDGDEAGEKAAYRSLSIFLECGIFPKAVFLPKDQDPDSYCLTNGRSGWDKIYSLKEDLFINVSKKIANSAKDDFNKKLIRFQSVKKMLSQVNDSHLRDYYVDIISNIFKLKKENINDDIAKERYQKSIGKKSNSISKNKENSTIYLCELDFIACLSFLPIDVIDNLIMDMNEKMFNDKNIRNIFKKILEVYDKISDIKELVYDFGDGFIDILSRNVGDKPYEFALENKEKIVANYLLKRKNIIIEEIKTASDDNIKNELLKELQMLTNKLARKHLTENN